MLVIRFTKIGRKNDAKFRLIVKEKRSKRDGAYVDQIGFYDPIASPHILKYDQDKLNAWLKKGAVLSEGVAKIIKLPPKPAKVKKSTPKKKTGKVASVVAKDKSEAKKTKAAPKTKATKKVATKKS